MKASSIPDVGQAYSCCPVDLRKLQNQGASLCQLLAAVVAYAPGMKNFVDTLNVEEPTLQNWPMDAVQMASYQVHQWGLNLAQNVDFVAAYSPKDSGQLGSVEPKTADVAHCSMLGTPWYYWEIYSSDVVFAENYDDVPLSLGAVAEVAAAVVVVASPDRVVGAPSNWY